MTFSIPEYLDVSLAIIAAGVITISLFAALKCPKGPLLCLALAALVAAGTIGTCEYQIAVEKETRQANTEKIQHELDHLPHWLMLLETIKQQLDEGFWQGNDYRIMEATFTAWINHHQPQPISMEDFKYLIDLPTHWGVKRDTGPVSNMIAQELTKRNLILWCDDSYVLIAEGK